MDRVGWVGVRPGSFVSGSMVSPSSTRILVVDDELPIREMLREYLSYQGYLVEVAGDGREAIATLRAGRYDLVLTDMKMPTQGGLELLAEIGQLRTPVTTILMTGYGTVDTAISAMKSGAYDYILKPFKLKDVAATLSRALEKVRLERENLSLKSTLSLYHLSEATTTCDSLDQLFEIYTEASQEELRADLVLHYMAGTDGEGFGIASFFSATPWGEADLYRFAESLDLPTLLLRFAAREPLLESDGGDSWFAVSPPLPITSLVAVPISLGTGEVVGATVALSFDVAHRFSEGHRKVALLFAGKIAHAVETTRLYGELVRNRRRTLTGLANVLMTKDPYIRHHSESVRRLTAATCAAMGLPVDQTDAISQGALLHDIGKVGIRLDKLHQKEKLTAEDYKMFQAHPDTARFILEPLTFLADITPVVYHHHERWDGRGYPSGLKGEEIPLGARIVAVCDAYDAITSKRVYVRDTSHDTALSELKRNAGTQFDPQVVAAFCAMIDQYRIQEGDYHTRVAQEAADGGEVSGAGGKSLGTLV